MAKITLEEVTQMWGEYQPLVDVDPLLTAQTRFKPHIFERMIDRAIQTGGQDNRLNGHLVPGRDLGADEALADTYWALNNWGYFQRLEPEKQAHLHRLAVVAGHFMDEDTMHPNMKEAVYNANWYV